MFTFVIILLFYALFYIALPYTTLLPLQFYLILNVAVGGTTYFSDSYINRPHPKPWSDGRGHGATDFWSARGHWYPTWNPTRNNGEDAALKVNYVKVWKTKPDP